MGVEYLLSNDVESPTFEANEENTPSRINTHMAAIYERGPVQLLPIVDAWS